VQGQIKGMEDKIVFEEIDVTKNRNAAKDYGINLQGTPTLIVLDANGKQVKVFVGTPTKAELDKAIDQAVSP
jgi:hypothetical protein